MARSQIARHPQRAEIERDIRAGVSARAIAKAYGFRAFSTVASYARKLREQDAVREERRDNKSDVTKLVERLDMCWSLLTNHIAGYDPATNQRLDKITLDVLREMRAVIREVANVRGLLRSGGITIGVGVNVANTNVNAQPAAEGGVPADAIKHALFTVMRRHPQVRDELAEEFRRLQNRYDGVVEVDLDEAPPPHEWPRSA